MTGTILNAIIEKTKEFLENMPKVSRKKIGQFFTSIETAKYMAEMFDVSLLPEHISILDPGTGSGILSAAIVDRLNDIDFIKSIHLFL